MTQPPPARLPSDPEDCAVVDKRPGGGCCNGCCFDAGTTCNAPKVQCRATLRPDRRDIVYMKLPTFLNEED